MSPKPEFSIAFGYFSNYELLKFHAQRSLAWKKSCNLGARLESSKDTFTDEEAPVISRQK